MFGGCLPRGTRAPAWCPRPPIGSAPEGVWAELECAFLNSHQARWQCFADSIGLGFAQGKSMLWRKEILQRGGGVRALAGEVAEDAASTKLVRKQGLRVRIVDRPFEQPLGRRSAADVWRRQLRCTSHSLIGLGTAGQVGKRLDELLQVGCLVHRYGLRGRIHLATPPGFTATDHSALCEGFPR